MDLEKQVEYAQLALKNVGIDATLEDCHFFNLWSFGDKTPFTELSWNAAKQKLAAQPQAFHMKADCEKLLLGHLGESQSGKDLMAKCLLESTEGRIALRNEMSRLQIDGLRDLLGFGSPNGLSE